MKAHTCPNCQRPTTPDELKQTGICGSCNTGRASVPPVLDPEFAHSEIEAKLDEADLSIRCTSDYEDVHLRAKSIPKKLLNIGDMLRQAFSR